MAQRPPGSRLLAVPHDQEPLPIDEPYTIMLPADEVASEAADVIQRFRDYYAYRLRHGLISEIAHGARGE